MKAKQSSNGHLKQDHSHCKPTFSKKSLELARKELKEREAHAEEVFISKIETDKKLEWL